MAGNRRLGGDGDYEKPLFPQQAEDPRRIAQLVEEPAYYILLPPTPPVLPYRRSAGRSSLLSIFLILIFLFCLLSVTVFFLWPYDPKVDVVRFNLNHVQISKKEPAPSAVSGTPSVFLDVSMNLTVRVSNRDFFAVDFHSMAVSIGYRGKNFGIVRSEGGHVRARRVSYVNATLDLDGLQVIHDVIYLLEDLRRGSVPFNSLIDFEGNLGLLFFEVPLKARVSCEVYVDTNTQVVSHQDCYPM